MHGSYRAVSGRIKQDISWGCWDTYESDKWPGNKFDRAYRGALHGTGAAYNGIPTQTGGANGGVQQMGGPERLTDVKDGTSNSLMVGEYTNTGKTDPGVNDGSPTSDRGTFWAYTYASYNQSSLSDESKTLNNDYIKCSLAPGQYGEQMCKRSFGSNHTTGMNFVLCDGSVRFVSYSTDVIILKGMATIDGGEITKQQ
jgi:prepilin-type processing-associated H-X9-DG protein